MSDRARHEASGVMVPEEELFDDVFLDREQDTALDPSPDREPDPAPDDAPQHEPNRAVGPEPGPAAYVDVLAEPERKPAPDGGTARPGVRERIRTSRFGTLVVLLVTAALVATGMWAVNHAKSTAAANGQTAISIPGRSTAPPPKVGTLAQDFTAKAIDGSPISLAALRGKTVWLVFGASWCAACQAEAPDIEAAYRQYASQGLVVVGVNIAEGADAVRDYAKRVGITFPMAADPDSAIADLYRVSAIPAHFYIDRTGVLREIRQGGVSPDTIATTMNALLKGVGTR